MSMILSLALVACTDPGASDPPAPEQIDLSGGGGGSGVRIDGGADADPSPIGVELCAVPDGGLYALWADEDHLWVNHAADGVTFRDAPVRADGKGSEVHGEDVACNEHGVFVVWETVRDGVTGNHQIYFNRSDDGGETFLPEDLLLERDPDGQSMSLDPTIVALDKDLFVVWSDNLNGAFDILGAGSSDAGGSFRPPLRIDSDDPAGTAHSGRPRVAFGTSELDLRVVWEDARDGLLDVYFARSDNGGTTFREDARIDEGDDKGSAHSFAPELCTDGQNGVTAVWHDARPGGAKRDAYTNRSSDGGDSWGSESVRVDDRAQGATGHPICATGDDAVHLAWTDTTDDETEVWTRALDDGEPSGEPVAWGIGREPRIAASDGTVAVGWIGGDGVSAVRLDEDGGSVVTVGGGAVSSMGFAVVDGEAAAAWVDPTGAVWFARGSL